MCTSMESLAAESSRAILFIDLLIPSCVIRNIVFIEGKLFRLAAAVFRKLYVSFRKAWKLTESKYDGY